MDKKEFLDVMLKAYWEAAENPGINCNQAVCLAQGAHESAWGNSRLFKSNNIFGIKATKSWKGDTVSIKGFEWDSKLKKMVDCMIKWRAYPSLADCITNYSQIINLNNCYRPALEYINNATRFLQIIGASWATDPKYVPKVITIGKQIQTLGGPTWV